MYMSLKIKTMNNNKQSMKLYTKEDFLKAAEFCEVSMIDAKYIIERIDEVTDPIELPIDEDKNLFYQKQLMNPYSTEEYAYTAYEKGFMEGAKTVINKIQGGNNEQQ